MARILLIDDDALLRDTVRQLLALDGHTVIEAEDGAVGLQKLRQGAGVDLVITDILMPVLDGAQVIVEIKRLNARLPVIAMSGGRRALSPQFNLETAALVGATQLLPKPFGRATLQAAVKDALTAVPVTATSPP